MSTDNYQSEEGFQALIKAHEQKLKASAFASFKNLKREDFDDCWQAFLIKVWNNIHSFRGEASFFTWAFIILKNEILDLTKKNNKQHAVEISSSTLNSEGDEIGYEGLDSFSNLSLEETALTIISQKEKLSEYKILIDKALEKLKPTHSEIIRLYGEEGLSYEEISQRLNIPIGSVMSRLHYARKYARTLIKL